jgi:endonuclease III-like uncharacterized protein
MKYDLVLSHITNVDIDSLDYMVHPAPFSEEGNQRLSAQHPNIKSIALRLAVKIKMLSLKGVG